MKEDVIGNTSFVGDVEPILPDGWKPGDDIFALADEPAEAPFQSSVDGQSDDEFLRSLTDEAKAEETVPTTDEPKAEEPSAESEATPEEEPSPVEDKKTSRILKAKVNHKEFEFDVNDTSDDDIIAWRQKADAFDAMKEAKAKETYRQVYQEQIDSGMSEGVAKLVAMDAANGKTYSLTDDEPEENIPDKAPEDERFANMFAELSAMKERMNEMIRQSNETVASIQKENNILKQNAAAAAKSPVKPVSGGGDVTPAKEDPMLLAFDSASQW